MLFVFCSTVGTLTNDNIFYLHYILPCFFRGACIRLWKDTFSCVSCGVVNMPEHPSTCSVVSSLLVFFSLDSVLQQYIGVGRLVVSLPPPSGSQSRLR